MQIMKLQYLGLGGFNGGVLLPLLSGAFADIAAAAIFYQYLSQ